MEMSALAEAQYHQKIFEMIGRNFKEQGYTKEQLHQYNLDRDNGLSEANAVKRLSHPNGA